MRIGKIAGKRANYGIPHKPWNVEPATASFHIVDAKKAAAYFKANRVISAKFQPPRLGEKSFGVFYMKLRPEIKRIEKIGVEPVIEAGDA